MLFTKATDSNSYILHTLMVVTAMQRCQPHHQEQFEVQYLAQGHFDMQTRGIKNQRPSDNKILALPLSHSRPVREKS